MVREIQPDYPHLVFCTLCRKDDDGCRCPICEYCGVKIDLSWMEGSDLGHFCSHDCEREHELDCQIAEREAIEMYEMYGDDFDSWYR